MKQTHHIPYIAAALLLILLLPLLAGCAKQEYPVASPEIPEGWEVVSTDGAITHLRMKEGADAYYWVDRYAYQLSMSVNIPVDVQIAGNESQVPLSPDKDGNVYFIVYFDRFYTEEIDGSYKLVDAPEDTADFSYSLHMENGIEDIMENMWGEKMFAEPWKLPALSEYNNVVFEPIVNNDPTDPEARVGLTNAVMIACPYDKLDTEWRTLIFRIEQSDGDWGYEYEEAYQPYGKWNGAVYFSDADLLDDRNPLYTKWFGIITTALILCSMILMVLCAIWKKNSFLHLIPIVLGYLYCDAAMRYSVAFPYPDHVMGEGLAGFFMKYIFIIAGVFLLIVRLLINLIRRLIRNARQNNEEQ